MSVKEFFNFIKDIAKELLGCLFNLLLFSLFLVGVGRCSNSCSSKKNGDEEESSKNSEYVCMHREYIDIDGLSYSIKNDTACFEKINDSTLVDIIVPNHIIDFNGKNVPVARVEAFGLFEYSSNNILSYSSDVDMPLYFHCENIEHINSRVSTICPNLRDLFSLKTLNLYGEDYILSFDYEDKFLQGCSSLEEVRISGASIVVIKDGFNYCTNLKTLIFDDVEYLFLSGGFRGTVNLDSIVVIQGDTTGNYVCTDKRIIYIN